MKPGTLSQYLTRDAEQQPRNGVAALREGPSRRRSPYGEPDSPRAALLFPGEYNQYQGMLTTCKHLPAVREMLALATECFGFDVEDMMRDGDEEDMARVDISQMLVFVADCAALELLREDQPEVLDRPHCVAGFGVGEYAALVAARCISFDQGLILVKARAEALRAWVEKEEFAAIGVYGLSEDELNRHCHAAQRRDRARGGLSDPRVIISHYWGEFGHVCSGHRRTVEQLQALLATQQRAYCHTLEHTKDAGHTSLAELVADEVAEVIKDIPIEPPECQVHFNVGFHVPPGVSPLRIEALLMRQLTEPVRWDFTMHTCIQHGVVDFYEVGPGESLKELMIFNPYADVHREVRPWELTKNIRV